MVVNLGQKDPISNFLIGYNSGFIRSTPCPQSSRIALGLTPGFLMKYFPPLLNATADYYNDSISFVEDYNNELVRTSNSSLQTDDGHPLWKEYTLTSIFVLLIIVTIFGNTLIIISVLTTRRLRTVTNCFVMSLAVADWLVGIFVMPFAVALHITGSWEFGWILCDIWISLDVCLCTASILSLCAISIDRYLAVTQPLTYSRKTRSKKLALYMILCVWLLALVITCPPILGWYDKDRHRDKKCGYNQNRGYVVFSGMGSFFIPLLVVLYVYARISCVIARRHNNLEALNQQHNLGRHEMIKHTCSHHHHHHHQHKPNHDESDKSEKGSSESEENLKAHNNNNNHHVLERECRKSQASCSLSLQRGLRLADKCTRVSSLKRESKTAQTLSVVVGGFIACWLPFFIVYLANPFLPDGTISPLLSSSLTWLGWLNSAINPFIYAFYSPDFRLAFWRLTIKHCNKSKRSRAQRAHMNMLDSSCRMRKQNHVTYNLRHHS